MLEGLVAGLLNRFLGMYLRNFDSKQLNVGIWSGDVKLRNLELRQEALDQLRLPINVVEGHVGLLTLSIPWSNLKGKPVKVFIEDVYLLAAPKEDAEYNEEEEAKREHALKMERLESAEMLREKSGEGLTAEEQQKNQNFTDSLVTKIIDNLQITVKRIHIRYEDSLSSPQHPFALGITLEEFSAVSTDGKWKPAFIQNSVGPTHKLATLGALAIYWNTDTKLFGTGKGTATSFKDQGTSHETILEQLRRSIVGSVTPSLDGYQFMLRPVNGQAKVEMDKIAKPDRPKLKAGLSFEEIGVVLDEEQYRDALMMIDLFHYVIRHQENKKYQPKDVTPTKDPMAWLLFACNAVLRNIHERNRRWTWAFMKERRDDRRRYLELYKKKKREETLTNVEADELEKLEWKLSYEDLRFWRSLARRDLRKERANLPKPKETKQPQGWVSWVWGSGKQQQQQQQQQGEEHDAITDEHRKELYDAIEWDERNAIAESVDVPRETIKLKIEASLDTGSLTLKKDPHGRNIEALSILFDNFGAKLVQRPDSFLARIALGGLRAYDGTTEGNLFRQIIKVKEPSHDIERAQAGDREEQSDHASSQRAASDHFFELEFEQNPLDGSADTAVTAKLKSMEVVYNPRFVSGVADFFRPPERHMESIEALLESAGQTVEGLRQQTRAGLEYALEEHKSINAKLDLQAPLIIVPESVTVQDSMCMILDAGHIRLKSELIDKATLRDIQSKQKEQYNEKDLQRLHGLMYDKFLLKLESTQLLIGSSVGEVKAQLEKRDESRNLHLIDRINVDFVLEASILPKYPNLTKFRLSGHLPLLQVSVSDQKYKRLMRLIQAATPKFSNDLPKLAEATPPAYAPSSEKRKNKASYPPGAGRRQSSALLLPTRRDLVLDDEVTDNEEDDPKEEVKNVEEQVAQLHQRNFEFKFTVDKLRGSLFRVDPEDKSLEHLLVRVVAESFELRFYSRPADMAAEVSLQSFNVEDHVEGESSSDFKRIIATDDGEATKHKSLLYVKYVRINQDSPEFMTAYEGIETHINGSLSTITLIVTRKTLLTLLDFILDTFQNDGAAAANDTVSEVQQRIEGDGTLRKTEADAVSKMRLNFDLTRISLVLNNDGIRLATLSLNTAKVSIFLKGQTMRIGARLGDFSLLDDTDDGAKPDSLYRALISIQGDDLADFRYETFDPQSGQSYPGYSSFIFLRSGSIKINFMHEPFHEILEFFVKFGRMQAIFNSARRAAMSQANQIQENADQIRFDILVKTPIVVFPRSGGSEERKQDVLTAYLGEIYASNAFVPLDDSEKARITNKMSAGIRHIRLTSDFHYPGDAAEELEILDKVDIDFQITYLEHIRASERPDFEIRGSMSDFTLRITQSDLKFLLQQSQAVAAAFTINIDGSDVEDVVRKIPGSTIEPPSPSEGEEREANAQPIVHLGPELGANVGSWTKMDLMFRVQTISLELISASENQPVHDIKAASLSKFALDQPSLKLVLINDGSIESELLVHSFTINDSRKQDSNKFRKIMSPLNQDVQQLMASITMSGGAERNVVAIVTVDSPRVILALDYLYAIQQFFHSGLSLDEPTEAAPSGPTDSRTRSNSIHSAASSRQSEDLARIKGARVSSPNDQGKPAAPGPMSLSYRVNVVDAQVILLANPATIASEAIVLSVKQVLMSQQHAMTLQVSQVGMYLCRMDKYEENRLRVLDDFGLQVSMQTRSQGQQASLTSIHIGVDPLILRLSLRDILLAVQIVNKASELSAGGAKPKDARKASTTASEPAAANGKRASDKRVLAGDTHSMKQATIDQRSAPESEDLGTKLAILSREELIAEIEGVRIILIEELHELPILDLRLQEFKVGVRDWSSQMNGDTDVDLDVSIYNFSKSTWEPLIEPWQLGCHVSREQKPDHLSVEVYSRKMLELTLTPASIALASKSAKFLSQQDDVLTKPRGVDAPYHIRNFTGFDISVWADAGKEEAKNATNVSDGAEIPWRFQDWDKVRENLTPEGNQGAIGISLDGSGFQSVNQIPVTREGETIYNLRPRRDDVVHRLLAEVRLGSDNVKVITLRSPMLLENNTQIPIEIGVIDVESRHLLKIEKVEPGDSRPAPVGAAYMHSLLVRPDQGFGYSWSSQRLYWKDLVKKNTLSLTCQSGAGDRTASFFFQVSANYDRANPITGIYPYMRVKLSAPLEIQNLLPFDFKYRIYDKHTKKDWTNFLRRGGLSPVHAVELSHLLLMSVHMQDTVFKKSEFSVINGSQNEEFRKENTLVVQDDKGLNLNLKLHY
ncbi:MAG: hypothetical protein M1826_000708 [Phylliscum demangeonii]|nr:MAG: hypothetical protein M1826_000708 [Phylliscum demangeonii]